MTWAICIVMATAAFFLGYGYGRLREKLRWMSVFGATRVDAGQFSEPVETGAAWALATAWMRATGDTPPFLDEVMTRLNELNSREIPVVK